MKTALIGYGKMGKTIEELLIQHPEDSVVLKIQSNNTDAFIPENLQKADVAIEFTAPHLAVSHIMQCVDAGVPVVCGTTGWYDQLPEVKAYTMQHGGKLLYAPNFSIGVNLFFEMNKLMAKMFSAYPQYNISISEMHHTEKKDAPSGTAIQIANQIIENNPDKTSWISGNSNKAEVIPIISFREPGVPGTHTITYSSEIDDITLNHTAKSRYGFAGGAILAAKWLLRQSSGVYTMRDVLHLH